MGRRNISTDFIKQCLADALLALMKIEPYEEINVKEICYKSGIGRTTYYRHFDNKNGKKDLLLFKLLNGWEEYCSTRQELVKTNSLLVFLTYFYENKPIFDLLKKNDLLRSILSELFFIVFNPNNYSNVKDAYGNAFLAGGFYGTTFYWIQNDFPESPQELHKICTSQNT